MKTYLPVLAALLSGVNALGAIDIQLQGCTYSVQSRMNKNTAVSKNMTHVEGSESPYGTLMDFNGDKHVPLHSTTLDISNEGHQLTIEAEVNRFQKLITVRATLKQVADEKTKVIAQGLAQAHRMYLDDDSGTWQVVSVKLVNPLIAEIIENDPEAAEGNSVADSELFPKDQLVIERIEVGCSADLTKVED